MGNQPRAKCPKCKKSMKILYENMYKYDKGSHMPTKRRYFCKHCDMTFKLDFEEQIVPES